MDKIIECSLAMASEGATADDARAERREAQIPARVITVVLLRDGISPGSAHV